LTDLYVQQAAGLIERKQAEEALRVSEERLRFAAQAAGFGIYELNLATGQAYRSPEYKALFGVRPNDEFQLDADQVPIYVHPDDRALLRGVTRESRDPGGSGTKDVEYRVVLPDGAARWLLVRGRTFFEGEGQARRPVRSRGIALDVTERKQLEQEILEISNREQQRIGQDLHDGLCQQLVGIEFRNSVLVQQLAKEEEAKTEALRIGELIRDATRQARLLAKGLSPVQLDAAGLMSALQELTSNTSKLFDVSCRFECPQPVLVADNTVATHLYRIVQEAISNAVKHGQARFIIVSLIGSADQSTLRIWNNGAEFPLGASAEGGLGLRIMQYRAEMIGATLKIASANGKGTTVECTFKMN
jgi:PAS domain S-box-containing protein